MCHDGLEFVLVLATVNTGTTATRSAWTTSSTLAHRRWLGKGSLKPDSPNRVRRLAAHGVPYNRHVRFYLGGRFLRSVPVWINLLYALNFSFKVPQILQYYPHLPSLSMANMVTSCNLRTTQWRTALLGLHLLLFPSLITPHSMARQPAHPLHLQLNLNSNQYSRHFNNLQRRSNRSNSHIPQRLTIWLLSKFLFIRRGPFV